MEAILIYIKHHFSFIWKIIEWGNSIAFSLFFRSKMLKILSEVFEEFPTPEFSYRRLVKSDAEKLFDLIISQVGDDLTYFSPHAFDLKSIKMQFSKPSFLMMGTFYKEKLVGYYFLRLFANKKCFVGRLIDKDYRGKGIGRIMNSIMYETAWRSGFRCLSTISKNNKAVIQAHATNRSMIVLKELNNNYLLIEFVKEDE